MFHPFVETVKQRGKADCCIAALAMLLGRTYEDVLAAAITKKHPQPHATGMYTLRQLQATARRLGIALHLRRTWDFETSTGLMTMEKIDPTTADFAQHVVLLKFGLIFDTDGFVWEPEMFCQILKFRPVSLLVEEE